MFDGSVIVTVAPKSLCLATLLKRESHNRVVVHG